MTPWPAFNHFTTPSSFLYEKIPLVPPHIAFSAFLHIWLIFKNISLFIQTLKIKYRLLWMLFLALPGRVSGFLPGAPTLLVQAPSTHSTAIQCLPLTPGSCAWSVQTLELFPQMNQNSKTVSSKWGARIPMNPEVAQAPGDDCTRMPCAISRAALQTGPDERLPATFLPLSLTTARGDFLQHVRQRLPV